jgi:hypothetical protein
MSEERFIRDERIRPALSTQRDVAAEAATVSCLSREV